ncbi:hypothetical protein ASPZODRAFT_162232 [Penicilliopsis zonata CBS 506.65]|uniref:Amidohydrolase-related domain-containing protein n=1 Tax=Penicilliopsis zonata CBS 506.65 TaxID=1073090 RepID=A0A1L9S5H5_9EURO|nr:hypothetical protein ASPZODRAFT_162232 [Penicilliopsis zonata CBS 506.65]OJJ42412.1 hypothetical protein ASPZODRAFT_162232 [Penicilliopsis zonata CBS 506.65]
MSSILLQNATILCHKGEQVQILRQHDLLIENDTIKRIGKNLALSEASSGRVIDCTGKIVSPGFVDTHHHLWQSQLRGRHGDHGFKEYMVTGNMQSFNYEPDDIFWGQLAGCLASIDAGVTTVVDHAHMSYSAEHVKKGIQASVSSGLRTVFCYTPIERIEEWTETVKFADDFLPDWWMPLFDELNQTVGQDGRVMLGLGIELTAPRDVAVALWKRANELGMLVTTHYVAGFMPNIVQILAENSLLSGRIIVSHATGIALSDAATLAENQVYISTTPETELQMGLGEPVALRGKNNSPLSSHTCVGVDCHSNNSSDLITQLRLLVQHMRGQEYLVAQARGEYAAISAKLEHAFNLGTLQGARAMGLEHKIGTLEEGKKADLVVFDTDTPAMVCADSYPLAAILLHASIRDIGMVIIDGAIVKENGQLNVTLDGETVGWKTVAEKLRQSQQDVVQRGETQQLEGVSPWKQ